VLAFGDENKVRRGRWGADRFHIGWVVFSCAAALAFGVGVAVQRGFSDAVVAVAPVFVIVALWIVISVGRA
jgi:hypothetical protein